MTFLQAVAEGLIRYTVAYSINPTKIHLSWETYSEAVGRDYHTVVDNVDLLMGIPMELDESLTGNIGLIV